jgi:hypothetical protein
MNEKYLYPMPGGTWVISRLVEDRYIGLHQDNPLFETGDAEAILRALGIPATRQNLDRFFPERKGQGRCPTLELMELANVLDPTNPLAKKRGSEVGV